MKKPVYYIVRHSPNLFAVMSKVKAKDMWGLSEREYTNFVAECSTEEEAKGIILKIESL